MSEVFLATSMKKHMARGLLAFMFGCMCNLSTAFAYEPSDIQSMMGQDALRQTIYDRNGAVIAASVLTASVFLNPLTVPTGEQWAEQLEEILSLPEGYIKEKLLGARGVFCLKEDLSDQELEDVLSLNLDCLEIYKKYKRIYPTAPVAEVILGSVDRENVATGGIEYFFDSKLKQATFDGDGENEGLHLTIDTSLQKRAEKELEWQMYRCRAKNGAFVITRLSDGQILALASSRIKKSKAQESQRHNEIFALLPKAKPLLLLPLFDMVEKGKEELEQLKRAEAAQEANGNSEKKKLKKQGKRAKKLRWRWSEADQNLYIWGPWKKEELEYVADPNHLLPYLLTSGLGTATNIELPYERAGSLPTHILGKWMLGEEVSATPLQILRAFNTIVTKGAFLDFHIIKNKKNSVSKVSFPSISEEALDYVLKKFTKAKGPVCAMVARTRKKPARYQAMALGFWPLENPQVSYILVVDDARWNPRKAKGNLGTPKRVAQLAVRLLKQPGLSGTAAAKADIDPKDKGDISGRMPNLLGLSMRNALETMLAKGIRVEMEGSGRVTKQVPRPGSILPENCICKLIGSGS